VALSQVIDIVNDRFGTDFNQADQLFFDQIIAVAASSEELQQAAQVNSLDKFTLLFNRLLESLFIERIDQNEEIFARYMNDTAFHVPASKLDRLARVYTKPADGSPLREVPLPLSNEPPVFEGGGEGLFSTLDDYLKFARLLLNGGELDGVRLLRPETVANMASNHLTEAQRDMDFMGLPFWVSMGFGLGLSVVMDPEAHKAMGAGGKGSFGWPGAFGTWWQADPQNDVILMYLIQDFVELTAETVVGAEQQDVPSRTALFVLQNLAYEALG
jgi:CubicO group peptidase (beta-lactamase class C family)